MDRERRRRREAGEATAWRTKSGGRDGGKQIKKKRNKKYIQRYYC